MLEHPLLWSELLPTPIIDTWLFTRELMMGVGHPYIGRAIMEVLKHRCFLVLSVFRFWQRRDSWAVKMALLIRYWWCLCTTGFPCQKPFGCFRIGTLEQCA